MRSHSSSLCLALLSLALGVGPASAAVSNRVLIIGVDGAAGSYTQTANMPNLDALAAAGSARYDWLNEGALTPNPPEGYGASGVNWSTIVTGASAPHHGVVDNSFGGNHFDEYPFFFKYLKQKDPTLYTASIDPTKGHARDGSAGSRASAEPSVRDANEPDRPPTCRR